MSFNKPLQQPTNVTPGGVATLRIPAEALTLTGIKLSLSGTTFDKTKINRVKVKIGPRTIWDLTYAQINAMNNYKAGADNTKVLLIDFTERDQAIFPVKEVGGIDLMGVLPVGEVFIEITIDATAVAPAITATGYFNRSQGNNPLVLKMVPFVWAQGVAGRFTLPIALRGALLKRLWLFYSGTNWTASANGNVSRVEAKKNGIVFFDQTCLDNRFDQSQFKKVPQGNLYVMDAIVDNNHDAHITTIRNQGGVQVFDSFEFNTYLTDAGGGTITCIAEVLDVPTNL